MSEFRQKKSNAQLKTTESLPAALDQKEERKLLRLHFCIYSQHISSGRNDFFFNRY